MTLRYLSVCSGIEAASVAWHPLGWSPVAFSEIEPFPCEVLAARFPDVPNWGDMTRFKEWPDAAIDLLVGGTPCQSFSVAGLRAGLADPRGNLALVYLAIADRYRPDWILWENVPGVLSSNDGRDFGAFLGGLAELGYGWAYRILDAQHVRVDGFGRAVPQRRRRVFVVGCLGGWACAAAVLFDAAGLHGDPAPRREARQDLAGPLGGCSDTGGVRTTDLDGGQSDRGAFITDVASTLDAGFDRKLGLDNQHVDRGCPLFVAHALRAEGFDASEDGTGRGTPIVPVQEARSAGRATGTREICFNAVQDPDVSGDLSGPLGATTPQGQAVLTPASRGRGDGHNPEIRSDGTANAVLTPNGGRGGIGVGAVAFDTTQITSPHCRSNPQPDGPSHALAAGAHPPALVEMHPRGVDGGTPDREANKYAVRRLVPVECERLQGFPDNFTAIERKKVRTVQPDEAAYLARHGLKVWTDNQGRGTSPHRTRIAADGPRYKALGNSMPVNVMRWLGVRIEMVRAVLDGTAAQEARTAQRAGPGSQQ